MKHVDWQHWGKKDPMEPVLPNDEGVEMFELGLPS